MIKEGLYLLIVFVGIPAGLILAKLCREELTAWKRRFTYVVIVSLILMPVVYVTNFEYKIPVIVALGFLVLALITITYQAEKTAVFQDR